MQGFKRLAVQASHTLPGTTRLLATASGRLWEFTPLGGVVRDGSGPHHMEEGICEPEGAIASCVTTTAGPARASCADRAQPHSRHVHKTRYSREVARNSFRPSL